MSKAISLPLSTLASKLSPILILHSFLLLLMQTPKNSPNNVSIWENIDKIKGAKWK